MPRRTPSTAATINANLQTWDCACGCDDQDFHTDDDLWCNACDTHFAVVQSDEDDTTDEPQYTAIAIGNDASIRLAYRVAS